ncbi:hypothetical protein LXL04_037551 [Taraxacum kok-saghyz]
MYAFWFIFGFPPILDIKESSVVWRVLQLHKSLPAYTKGAEQSNIDELMMVMGMNSSYREQSNICSPLLCRLVFL